MKKKGIQDRDFPEHLLEQCGGQEHGIGWIWVRISLLQDI